MEKAHRFVSLAIIYLLVFALTAGVIAVTPAGSILGPVLVILLVFASFLLGMTVRN